MKIKMLDHETAEQIAAGEIIENPASVIKELVENALDAGASRIEVEIAGGGKKLIRVTDNGCGMERDDLPLAFQRFATSKIEAICDLEHLGTLGFRGEALPSISAVARVTLTTRVEETLAGSRVSLAGGKIEDLSETGSPPGTRVEVMDLFYNTPGRLKFLKADSVESGKISTLLVEMALTRPGVSFKLISSGKKVLATSGDGILLHAIASLYGGDTAEAMLEIRKQDRAISSTVEGFISAPYLTRASRRYIVVVVNGRLVKNGMIVNALERGYGDLRPRQRYPVAVVYLHVPPAGIDVNVHPTKTEIRFQDPESVKALVYRAVKTTLQGAGAVQKWPKEQHAFGPLSIETAKPFSLSPRPVERTGRIAYGGEDNPRAEPLSCRDHAVMEYADGEELRPDENLEEMRLIGQYLHSYLVVQKGEQLLLVDQHAAHERVTYHQLQVMAEKAPEEKTVQQVVPLSVELPAAWRGRVQRLLPLLKEAGFELEQIGEDSYALRAVPFVVNKGFGAGDLHDLLENLITEDEQKETLQRETVLKTLACHRSVRAKNRLSEKEMEELLRLWQQTPQAGYCPHGRPTVIILDRRDLEKRLQRRGT